MGSTLCFNLGGVDTENCSGTWKNPDELGNHPRLGKYIRDPRAGYRPGLLRADRPGARKGDLTFDLPESGLGLRPLPTRGAFHVNAIRLPAKTRQSDRPHGAGGAERGYLMNLFAFINISPAARKFHHDQRRRACGNPGNIEGEYRLVLRDIQAGTRFDDAVVRTKWGYTDAHSGSGMQWSFSFIEGPYYIPYRALVPQRVDGLLAAGRLIRAEQAAMAPFRIMPVCSAIGEAAGRRGAVRKAQTAPRHSGRRSPSGCAHAGGRQAD